MAAARVSAALLLFEGVLESRMYVSYRKPVELFGGGVKVEGGREKVSLQPAFADFTYQNTKRSVT